MASSDTSGTPAEAVAGSDGPAYATADRDSPSKVGTYVSRPARGGGDIMMGLRGRIALIVALLVLVLAPMPQAQGTPPSTPLALVSRDVRRPVPTTMLSN